MPSGCQTGHSVRFFQKRLQSYVTNYFVSMFCYVCHASAAADIRAMHDPAALLQEAMQLIEQTQESVRRQV